MALSSIKEAIEDVKAGRFVIIIDDEDRENEGDLAMAAEKVIIVSTHILEEVEAACTRAIIIDRGQIVANGTPAELKAKSELAGAVTLRVLGVPAETIKAKLGAVPGAKKAAIVREEEGLVVARVYPVRSGGNGQLARAVGEVARQDGWKIEQQQTEEGRMDEVFRSITLPDTAKGGQR